LALAGAGVTRHKVILIRRSAKQTVMAVIFF
jgi:hypothetical protein